MIPFNNLSYKVSSNYFKLINIFKCILKSNHFINGDNTKLFEKTFSEYNGVKFTQGVANGTDGLKLAINAYNLINKTKALRKIKVGLAGNAGGYAFVSILSDSKINQPIFIDVDEDTSCISYKELKKTYTSSGLHVLVYTHLYGGLAKDFIKIVNFCKKNKIYLIEDCSQSHGACINGKKVGSFGACGVFSFYPTKNLGCLGDGGAVITNSKKVNDLIFKMKQYGWKKKYYIDVSYGQNSRLDEIQAAFLNIFINDLDKDNQKRRELAKLYIDGITNKMIITPNVDKFYDHVFHLFVVKIRNNKRKRFLNYLKDNNIGYDIHFPILDSNQNVFKSNNDICLLGSERLTKQIVSIPLYPSLKKKDVMFIIKCLNNFS